MGRQIIQKVGRDASSGRFVSVTTARRHPATTVVETIRRPWPRRIKTRR